MKRDSLRRALSIFVMLIAMVACVLPGQTIQSTPGIDSKAVSTAVAGTAQAAAQATATVQPAATSRKGTQIEQAADGIANYSDYDAGFKISFPVGWLVVRPNAEEFNATLAKNGAINQVLHDQMTADLAGYQADYDRLYAYMLRPDIEKNALFGFAKLVWASKDATSIDNPTVGELVRGLEAPGGIPGFRADTAQVREDGAVKIIEIGGHFALNNKEGTAIPFYTTIIFFKPSSNSTARITFSFLEEYHTQISMDVKSIVESIRINGAQP